MAHPVLLLLLLCTYSAVRQNIATVLLLGGVNKLLKKLVEDSRLDEQSTGTETDLALVDETRPTQYTSAIKLREGQMNMTGTCV